MIYKVEWIENKSADWKVATLVEAIQGGATISDISINRNNKDGTVAFANFDELMPGSIINGNPWLSPKTNKWSLFPERPAPKNDAEVTTRNTPQRGPAGMMATKAANIAEAQSRTADHVEKAQERTFEHVKEAQGNKNNAIKVAAAMRDATLIAIALMGEEPDGKGDFPSSFTRIKEWYLSEWDKTEKSLDVPF